MVDNFRTRRIIGGASIAVSLFVLGLALALTSCPQRRPATEIDTNTETELDLAVTHPIVLIHGLGGSAKRWQMSGTVEYLEEQGLSFGGTVFTDEEGEARVERPSDWSGGKDFFAVHISDPFQSLDLWSWEIANAVDLVLRETGAPKVAMLGFSAGGLGARKYLVDHRDEHRVARLVTLASPHLGSELALAALAKDRLKEVELGGGLGGTLAGAALAGLEAFEAGQGQDLDSDLVHQLVPVKLNSYLQELNSSPHPGDVDYFCVVVEEQMGAGRDELHREISKLRAGLESRILAEVANAVMRLVKLLGEGDVDWSLGGDGVVLAESQNLFNVEAFRTNRELEGRSINLRGQHLKAPESYPELLEALAGDVGFRWAGPLDEIESSSSGRQLYFYFDNILAGLARVEALAGGQRVPASRPRVFTFDGESYARSTIGPVPEGSDLLDVRVTTAAGEPIYAKWIQVGDSVASPEAEVPDTQPSDRVIVRFESVAGIPARKSSGQSWDWSPIPGAEKADPDLWLEVEVDGEARGATRVIHDVSGTVTVREELILHFWPRESRVVLRLWDHDGASSEGLGQVVWNPGRLPDGPVTVETSSGIAVTLEVEWDRRPRIIRDPEVFRLEDSQGL